MWMNDQAHVTFRQQCADILEAKGDDNHFGKLYEDENVRIQSGWGQLSLEVTILPAAHPNNLHNPCVMNNLDGKCIRHHGEWKYIKEHVETLHASL